MATAFPPPRDEPLEVLLAFPRQADGFVARSHRYANMRVPGPVLFNSAGTAANRDAPPQYAKFAGAQPATDCATFGCASAAQDPPVEANWREGALIQGVPATQGVTHDVASEYGNPGSGGDYTGGSPNNDDGEHWGVKDILSYVNLADAPECTTPLPSLPWSSCGSALAGSEKTCGRPPCAECGSFDEYVTENALESLDLTFSSGQYVPGWLLLEDWFGGLFGSAFESDVNEEEQDLIERASLDPLERQAKQAGSHRYSYHKHPFVRLVRKLKLLHVL